VTRTDGKQGTATGNKKTDVRRQDPICDFHVKHFKGSREKTCGSVVRAVRRSGVESSVDAGETIRRRPEVNSGRATNDFQSRTVFREQVTPLRVEKSPSPGRSTPAERTLSPLGGAVSTSPSSLGPEDTVGTKIDAKAPGGVGTGEPRDYHVEKGNAHGQEEGPIPTAR